MLKDELSGLWNALAATESSSLYVPTAFLELENRGKILLTVSVAFVRVALALSPLGVSPRVPPDPLLAGLNRERRARSHKTQEEMKP